MHFRILKMIATCLTALECTKFVFRLR